MSVVPTCAVHLGVPMAFEPSVQPRFKRRKGPTINDVDASFDLRSRLGLWRCPVRGCARVAAPEYVRPEIKDCPKCGRDTTKAVWHAPTLYDYRCRRCYRNAQRINNRKSEEKRKKRKERYDKEGT